jgi:hypothetical protein
MDTNLKLEFNDLTLQTVMQLYQQKLVVEAKNDIKGRTRLLQKYPELFDAAIWDDVAATCEMVRCLERKQLIGQVMRVMLL